MPCKVLVIVLKEHDHYKVEPHFHIIQPSRGAERRESNQQLDGTDPKEYQITKRMEGNKIYLGR